VSISVVPFYAALLASLFIFLSVRVIRMRRRHKLPIGDGGNPQLQRATAVQANFAEYVPFALILLAFAELRHIPAFAVHLLCLALFAGRLANSVGASQENENYRFRAGMSLTFMTIGLSALLLLGSIGLQLL
jgi:uncharacterized membrane protein YecN with MAPEG domain